ncbi:MAG: hypothetical protein JXA77_03865 [Bacteroidales bacterium]|nr:hypothetical protein [Bacteroidales bacterium]MBN2820327.1 hypothetical protein [Bacteroidales bacterium]
MPGVEKINHKGKEILYINYQGCKSDEEMIQLMKKAVEIIITDNKEYLQLTDMTNAFATPGYMKEAKKIAQDAPKLAKKRAIVGINSPARVILLKAYNMVIGSENSLKPFSNIEEAKDWLVK